MIRGTALRDASSFIEFSDFTNQFDYAGAANALNDYALRTVVGRAAGSTRSRAGPSPSSAQPERRSVREDGAIEIVPVQLELVEAAAKMTATPSPVLAARRRNEALFAARRRCRLWTSRFEQGRVHALIGENGAGKSTLVKILAGVERPTSGELRFDGAPVHFASPREASQLGIDIIHQELQLFPDLSIEENLFVGRERRTRWGTIDRAAQRTAAAAVLERLGQRLAIERRVGSLPLGQQQIVEIARAVVHDTRVLMMDEPTSALTASEIPVLFNLIRDLASHGVGIVYISHRLEELLAVADDVTVLRDGAVVGHAPRTEVASHGSFSG